MEVNTHVQILTEPVTSAACPKCGAMLEIPDIPAFTMVQCPTCEFEFPAPAKFGSFLLLQVLGMGGMGGVYRARDEALNREVAIKVMLKSLGDDPLFVETFQREAQAAAKLNHPNIAQVYSFGQVMGQPYIAMELIPGGSLDKMMAAQKALDPAVVFHVGVQIAEGLSEAAGANLVHGDVKPENILFDAEKNAKLVDFGLAAMQTGPNQEVWGTPYYIAPEKVRKQKTDCRSDIYSLGATLYHAIAGVPPFDGADAAAVVKARFDGAPKSLRSLRGNVVPEEVENIIMRMLAVNPIMRYPTYESLLGDMRRFLSTAGPVNVASSGKKILIRGKRPKLTASPVGAATDAAAVPEGMTPVDQIEAEAESERAARRRGRKILGLVVLGIVLLVGVSVGGVFGIRHVMEQKNTAKEAAADEANRKKWNADIATALNNAKRLAERVNANVPEVTKLASDAAEVVVAALGEEMREWLVPPEPTYEVTPSAAVPGGGKFSLDDEEAERLAKLLPPDLAKAVKELDKLSPDEAFAKMEEIIKALPEKEGAELKQDLEMAKAFTEGLGGAMAAAMGEAMQQMAAAFAEGMGEAMQQMAEGMATAMGGAMEGFGADGGGMTVRTMPSYPVISMVRGMFTDSYGVKKSSALATSLVTEIEALAKGAEALQTSAQKDKLLTQRDAIIGRWNAMNGLRELSDASLTVTRMKKTLESVRAEVASLAAIRQQQAVEQARAEKREADLEKQRLEREALQAQTVAELAKVRNAEREIVPMLKQLQIREATRLLRSLSSGIDTKGGLDAQAAVEERIKRIEEFHNYLVEKAPGFKSSRGWAIETADAKTMTVSGKKIPWSEIFETRMEIVAELINGLVMNVQATRNMRIRERTRLETNAALCLFMFYGDVPSAVDRARQIATQAADNFGQDADIIKSLMPEFFD